MKPEKGHFAYFIACPYCGGKSVVRNTYAKGRVKIRFRVCLSCAKRFKTTSEEKIVKEK
ncbi:MAG: hypothetical protein Q4D62_11355 [Planctomycetia bacterium]|nr:hypothetical protein [Planctomycetia bacterium]